MAPFTSFPKSPIILTCASLDAVNCVTLFYWLVLFLSGQLSTRWNLVWLGWSASRTSPTSPKAWYSPRLSLALVRNRSLSMEMVTREPIVISTLGRITPLFWQGVFNQALSCRYLCNRDTCSKVHSHKDSRFEKNLQPILVLSEMGLDISIHLISSRANEVLVI